MIQAVIFDCFGVLASDGWLPFKARYFSQDEALNMRATMLNKASDAGKMSYDDFIRSVAEMAGLTEAVTHQQIENNIPDEKVFTYIQELKQRYKIGLLSNASDNWLDEIFTPEQVALFDAVSLSCDTGFIKPEPRAYEIIIEKLGVQPSECVFIDDQPRYVDGAKEAGMAAILYGDAEQLRQELSLVLADS